jgi:hypothetical protein
MILTLFLSDFDRSNAAVSSPIFASVGMQEEVDGTNTREERAPDGSEVNGQFF